MHALAVTNAEVDALAAIKGFTSANRISIEFHARKRMNQRGVRYEDLRSALSTATACRDQRADSARTAAV